MEVCGFFTNSERTLEGMTAVKRGQKPQLNSREAVPTASLDYLCWADVGMNPPSPGSSHRKGSCPSPWW